NSRRRRQSPRSSSKAWLKPCVFDRDGAIGRSPALRLGDSVHQLLQLRQAAAPIGQVENAVDQIDGAGGLRRGVRRPGMDCLRLVRRLVALRLLLGLAAQRLERLALVADVDRRDLDLVVLARLGAVEQLGQFGVADFRVSDDGFADELGLRAEWFGHVSFPLWDQVYPKMGNPQLRRHWESAKAMPRGMDLLNVPAAEERQGVIPTVMAFGDNTMRAKG